MKLQNILSFYNKKKHYALLMKYELITTILLENYQAEEYLKV